VVLITNVSYTNEEAKKRIRLTITAMPNLTKIIKFLEVSTNTKVKLQQTTILPAVLYKCKRKQIKERFTIPWTVRRINTLMTNRFRPKYYLVNLIKVSKF